MGAPVATRVAAACTTSNVSAPAPIAELRAAPSSVVLGGQTLVLVPSLWRDFQPSSPPDGQPLVAVLRVTAANGAALTASVRIDTAWVINGNQAWTAPVTEERMATDPVSYEAVIRNGPKWGPGIAVDVVVRVRETGGATSLLKATNVHIGRTD